MRLFTPPPAHLARRILVSYCLGLAYIYPRSRPLQKQASAAQFLPFRVLLLSPDRLTTNRVGRAVNRPSGAVLFVSFLAASFVFADRLRLAYADRLYASHLSHRLCPSSLNAFLARSRSYGIAASYSQELVSYSLVRSLQAPAPYNKPAHKARMRTQCKVAAPTDDVGLRTLIFCLVGLRLTCSKGLLMEKLSVEGDATEPTSSATGRKKSKRTMKLPEASDATREDPRIARASSSVLFHH